jgi:hypothetical protein
MRGKDKIMKQSMAHEEQPRNHNRCESPHEPVEPDQKIADIDEQAGNLLPETESDDLDDEGEELDDEPEPKSKRRPPKMIFHNDQVWSAVGAAYEGLIELAGEAREIVDNASDNLRATQRIQSFEETADQLESLEAPEVRDSINRIPVAYALPKRRYMSRVARASDAATMLEACVTALRAIKEDDPRHADAASVASDLEETISVVECCDFPGMYG